MGTNKEIPGLYIMYMCVEVQAKMTVKVQATIMVTSALLFVGWGCKESFRILLCAARKIVSTSGNDAVQDLDPVNSCTRNTNPAELTDT
jgi:hypothetical protein